MSHTIPSIQIETDPIITTTIQSEPHLGIISQPNVPQCLNMSYLVLFMRFVDENNELWLNSRVDVVVVDVYQKSLLTPILCIVFL